MPKSVSAATLKSLCKQQPQTVTVQVGELDGKEITIDVKYWLTVKEFGQFVSEMSDVDWADYNYYPQTGSIMFDFLLCKYYTNLNLPDDIQTAWDIINGLNLADKIINQVGTTQQYRHLVSAIQDARNYAQAQRTGLNGLIAPLKRLLDNFDANEALKAIQGFTPDAWDKLGDLKQLAGLLNGFQPIVNYQEPVYQDTGN